MHRTKPLRILVLALLLPCCVTGSSPQQPATSDAVTDSAAATDVAPDVALDPDAVGPGPDDGGPGSDVVASDAGGDGEGLHFEPTCLPVAHGDKPTERIITLDPPDRAGPLLGQWDALTATTYMDQTVTLARPGWALGAVAPAIKLDAVTGPFGTGAVRAIEPSMEGATFGLRIHFRVFVVRNTDGPLTGFTILTNDAPTGGGNTIEVDLGVDELGIVFLNIWNHPDFDGPANLGSTVPGTWHEVMITTTNNDTSVCLDGTLVTFPAGVSDFTAIGLLAFTGAMGGSDEVGGYLQVDALTVDRIFPPTPPPPPPAR